MQKQGCINCGSNDIQSNRFGETVCGGCGQVQESSRFDNSLAFNEMQGVIGQRVDRYSDNPHGRRCYGGYLSAFEEEMEKTLDYLKYQLQVHDDYINSFEIARNLLKLAYMSMTMNEKWQNVHIYAGASLYFGFRSMKAPYLLIDISDKLKNCNVIKLARCYLRLLNFLKQDCQGEDGLKLAQNLQFIDPSIYIPRFVRSLEFREKQSQIVGTAKKLVQGMMLNWMCYGRRPSSLCGAALLIAARSHGENLTITEVSKTVFVCDETIRKRLAEFNQTKLAQLTFEQFEQIKDLEKDVPGTFMDPPSFTRARDKEAAINKIKELTEGDEEQNELMRLTMEEAMKLELIKNPNLEKYLQKNPIATNELAELIEKECQQFKDNKEESSEQSEQSVQAMKKESKQFQVKEGALSDLSEGEADKLLLTKEESNQKKIFWNSIYGEWMEEKTRINLKKAQIEKQEEGNIKKKRKKQPNAIVSNAPDPQTAILEHSKFGKQVNKQALDDLFEKEKKVKVEVSKPMLDQNDFLKQLSAIVKEEAEIEEQKSKKIKQKQY